MTPILFLILILCIVFLVPLFERGVLYGFFGIKLVICGILLNSIIVENRDFRNDVFEDFTKNTNFFKFCVMDEPHDYHNVKFICEELK